PDWTAHNVALGAQPATLPFYVAELPTLSSLYRPRTSSTVDVIDVRVRRLDESLSPLPSRRIFLKTDTQGHDLAVLEGATGCLRDLVLLQSEISVEPIYSGIPHYLESLRYYESLGFALLNLSPVTRNQTRETIVEYDALMVRRSSVPAVHEI